MKTISSSLWIALAIISLSATVATQAFQPPTFFSSSFSVTTKRTAAQSPSSAAKARTSCNTRFSQQLFVVKKDKQQGVSSSGYRQDRLKKLAELESERIETDKSFVLKAAGGFVGFIVILLMAAFASGILYQV